MKPEALLAFWFSDRVRPLRFRSTTEFDQEVSERFLSLWQAARDGRPPAWRGSPGGLLALVILLDQFPLHMFRGQAEAFTTEAASRAVAAEALDLGYDREMNDEQRAFLYLPFMHSESLADQTRSVTLFEGAGLVDNLRWAHHHRELIQRFGRFPHRNALLGRSSSPEELDYLASKGAFTG